MAVSPQLIRLEKLISFSKKEGGRPAKASEQGSRVILKYTVSRRLSKYRLAGYVQLCDCECELIFWKVLVKLAVNGMKWKNTVSLCLVQL
jgi:hypothetical protein